MKAKDLIEVLKFNPEADILISVDVSTNEDDYDRELLDMSLLTINNLEIN